MDFVRIIRSLEELLYEVMTWIIFYPRTMARILFNPTRMTLYSEAELGDAPDEQYTDSLSPPLLLMLTIVLTHGIELAVGLKATSSLKAGTEFAKFMTNEQNLLIVRALVTAIVPLVIALVAMRASQTPLDRNTLRKPFFSQCFLATPFAFVFSLSTIIGRLPGAVAGGVAPLLFFGAVIWLVWAETRWFGRQHAIGLRRAVVAGIGSVVLALSAGLAVAVALTLLL
jgi:hypothetical protein